MNWKKKEKKQNKSALEVCAYCYIYIIFQQLVLEQVSAPEIKLWKPEAIAVIVLEKLPKNNI